MKLISEITKNAREKIVAALDEYKGREIISLWVWYRDNDVSEWKPSKKGLAFRKELLPEFRTLIEKVEKAISEPSGALSDEKKG